MYIDSIDMDPPGIVPLDGVWEMTCHDLRYPQDNYYLTAENECILEVNWSTGSWKYESDGHSNYKLKEEKWTQGTEEGVGEIQDFYYLDGEIEIETSTYLDGVLDHHSIAVLDFRGAMSEDWSRICLLPGADWQSLDWIKEYGREQFVADTTGEYCVILCQTGRIR